MLTLISLALARPTEGGSYSFDDTDQVTSLDSTLGTVRVWYSTEGPNVVNAGDADSNGLPDFAEVVAATAEDVLLAYIAAGFRPVVSDGTGGGSDAMDVYLVDFGGDADGNYAAERCDGDVCSGYFTMENDFSGYGYASDTEAIAVLTSHELFHAVQAAYNSGLESWYSEGTAVWAEKLYDPDSQDFEWFCDAYLDDTGRSLNVPPTGPVPSFAYGTALWWYFVTHRYGDAWMVEFVEATTEADPLEAMAERVDLGVDFVDFAAWNLATGTLAGATEGYDFALQVGPPKMEDREPYLEDDQRFYPLSTTYYKLEWPGGAAWFGLESDAPDVVFQLWGTDGEGRVSALVAEPASLAGATDLGELPAGDYYLMGVNPTLAEDSTKVRFCLGDDVTACVPVVEDTGTAPPVAKGCGCDGVSGGGGLGLGAALLGAGLAAGRRRSGLSAI